MHEERTNPFAVAPPVSIPRDHARPYRVVGEDGALAGDPALNEEATTLYRAMVTLRLVSAHLVAMQRAGEVPFHASSIGWEAVVAGVASAAAAEDWLVPSLRAWGLPVLRGLGIEGYLHQVFGTASDGARGRQAPDHPGIRAGRCVHASGIAGAPLPLAMGIAWAARLKGATTAAVAVFDGDVADGGDFHNALNFAGVQKAPCVFVGCVSADEEGPTSLASKATAYGVASARVDGACALAVRDVVRRALDRARRKLGPTLVEVRVPSLVDAADVAMASGAPSSDALLSLGDHDPVAVLARALQRGGLLGAEAGRTLADEVRRDIATAFARVATAARPSPETMFEDVYRTMPAHLDEQRRAFTALPPRGHASKEPTS